MSNEIEVIKNRTNIVTVDLGINITGETIRSQIRSEPKVTAPLLCEWAVTITDAATGKLRLTLDDVLTAQVVATSGFMDVLRISNGEPIAAFDKPLEVSFIGAVTL